MHRNKRILALIVAFLLTGLVGQAQSPIDQYVRWAVDSNLALRQQYFSLQKGKAALLEAKRLFYPSVDFRADYTLAGGGRTIDLPLGDLLNPVYSTLNQLTASDKFPTLRNESVLLNPHNFYDVKVRTSGVIYNPELKLNQSIKQQQVELQQIEIEKFKRELKQQVQVAYYGYQQAYEAIGIYREAIRLLQEQQRVNESLYRNGKANRTAAIRAGSEVEQMQATLVQAEANRVQAAAYFNFLLNRGLRDSIVMAMDSVDGKRALPMLNQTEAEEAKLVQQGEQLLRTQLQLVQSNAKPRVQAFLDLGSQAFGVVNRQSWYYLAGISLQWNLFNFKRQDARKQQVNADLGAMQTRTMEVKKQLELRYIVALESFEAADQKHLADRARVQALSRYYQDVFHTYKQGQALYIELLDAQQQFTQAQIQSSISKANRQSKWADLERAAIR